MHTYEQQSGQWAVMFNGAGPSYTVRKFNTEHAAAVFTSFLNGGPFIRAIDIVNVKDFMERNVVM